MMGMIIIILVLTLLASCQQTCMTYKRIPLLCVLCKTADDGQTNCPNHIKLYSKNKSKMLVQIVGIIITIYHDARSAEQQSISAGL